MELPHVLLLVDDDCDLRESLAALLRAEGYDVVLAEGGDEALGHLRRGLEPCLILLDLMMPHTNGWEFRAEQLRDPILARFPVAVLSGDGQVREKARQLGVAGHLSKPPDIDRLLKLVAAHCPPRWARGY
jgi:CheY-like chemotaxis protein